jgi:hypothetical protein
MWVGQDDLAEDVRQEGETIEVRVKVQKAKCLEHDVGFRKRATSPVRSSLGEPKSFLSPVALQLNWSFGDAFVDGAFLRRQLSTHPSSIDLQLEFDHATTPLQPRSQDSSKLSNCSIKKVYLVATSIASTPL